MAKDDRTEKASAKKRRDTLRKGQVPRSKEIPAAAGYLVVLLFLKWNAGDLISQMGDVLRTIWQTSLVSDITILSSRRLLVICGLSVIKLAGPLILLTLVVGVSSSCLLGGVMFKMNKLELKWESLNPAGKVKSVFSTRVLMELGKASGIILVITYLGIDVLWDRMDALRSAAFMSIPQGLAVFGDTLYSIGARVALFLVVWAVADYFYQKHTFEEGLKQTKQEVKDDNKQMEGDPLIKGRIRRAQREIARRRMMAALKNADVVITNPTQYAVALKYEIEKMSAPKVVAKGRGPLARRIKEVAKQHNIPTVENVPLAQALYKSVEIDAEIPGQLYQAVAKILAYVYKLRETSWH